VLSERRRRRGRLGGLLFERSIDPATRINDLNVPAPVLDKLFCFFEGGGERQPLEADDACRVETADFKHAAPPVFLKRTPFGRVVSRLFGAGPLEQPGWLGLPAGKAANVELIRKAYNFRQL